VMTIITGRHKSTTEAISQETCQTGTLVGSRGMTTAADRHSYVLFCDGDKKFTVVEKNSSASITIVKRSF